MQNLNTKFPKTRLRRIRMNGWSRELLAQHRLSAVDLVLPIFIQDGTNTQTPISSLPDVSRVTLDILLDKAKEAQKAMDALAAENAKKLDDVTK